MRARTAGLAVALPLAWLLGTGAPAEADVLVAGLGGLDAVLFLLPMAHRM